MNLEQEILDFFGKENATAMDRQLYLDLMFTTRMDEGWQHVQISKFVDNYHAIDITYWLAENVEEDEYQRDRRDFIFKHGRDATAFMLRWL